MTAHWRDRRGFSRLNKASIGFHFFESKSGIATLCNPRKQEFSSERKDDYERKMPLKYKSRVCSEYLDFGFLDSVGKTVAVNWVG